jgi:hypothetical protein
MANPLDVPRRLWRTGRTTIETGLDMAGLTVGAVRALAGTVARRAFGDGRAAELRPPSAPEGGREVPTRPASRTEPPPRAPAARPRRREGVVTRPVAPPAATPPPPAHVSEEPVLVAELADPGAEDGAGAEVRVSEPWEGYNAQNANIIGERLPAVSDEALAAVELFETTHRRRRTVVEAAARELRRRTASRR